MNSYNLDMAEVNLPTKTTEPPEQIHHHKTTPAHSKVSATKSLPILQNLTPSYVLENSLFKKSLENRLSVFSSPPSIEFEKRKFPAAVSIVEELEKVKEIVHDTEQTKELVSKMLPKDVAKQLKVKNSVEPQEYENVTIYFSDIVGFTTLVSEIKPKQVYQLNMQV
jgi:hypothetical protein